MTSVCTPNTATRRAWEHRWVGLADYFAALESDWRGWKGQRVYESTEDDLRLTATHDGHVWLHIELWHERDASDGARGAVGQLRRGCD